MGRNSMSREQAVAEPFVESSDTLVAETDVVEFLREPLDADAVRLGQALANVTTVGLLQHRTLAQRQVLGGQPIPPASS